MAEGERFEAQSFNRDSRPDLAVANRDSDNVTILLGDGTGDFTAAATGPEAAGFFSRSVAVGDFNGARARTWRWPTS